MLLDYVVFAVLIFYVLTIAGMFVLRRTRPQAERPYRAFGYPLLPAFYIVAATVILLSWPFTAPKLHGPVCCSCSPVCRFIFSGENRRRRDLLGRQQRGRNRKWHRLRT